MYDTSNIFAKIIRKEIPAKIVFEDEATLAFHDVNPASKIHVLVVPKGEYVDFEDFISNSEGHIIKNFFSNVKLIAKKLEIAENGYRLIINKGKLGGQTVPHFHIHILGGQQQQNF